VTALLVAYEAYVHLFPCGASNGTDRRVYAAGEAVEGLASFPTVLAAKDDIFGPELGPVGEKYVRALFLKAGYRCVTRRRRLGNVWMGQAKADVSNVFRTYDGHLIRAFVQVKNQREIFPGSSGIFEKLIADASQAGAQPALVAAHLSRDAERRCETTGIAYLHLGRQLIPRAKRKNVLALPENVIGIDLYDFINPNRPFQHFLSDRALAHLQVVVDPAWLPDAFEIWRRRLGIVLPKGLLS
jgi:hypothetical protein